MTKLSGDHVSDNHNWRKILQESFAEEIRYWNKRNVAVGFVGTPYVMLKVRSPMLKIRLDKSSIALDLREF